MTPSSLTTRCAHCHTVFRVTPAQLQAHAGQVRCGRCMQVFDALAALAPEPSPAPAGQVSVEGSGPSAEVMDRSSPEPAIEPVLTPQSLETDAASAGASAQTPAEPSPVTPSESVPAAETLADQPYPVEPLPAPADSASAAAQGIAPESMVEEPVPDPDNPFIRTPAENPGPPQRRLRAAAAVLGMVLAAQALFFYRSEVAARFPLAKQGLGWLCAQTGCDLTLPQRPQSILIEASDLQVIDPANPNRIQLTATLRNHAGHDVAYPALDLVLTNVNDHTLARRIFLPAEYLDGRRDIGAGIAANAEMTVRLALETGNLGASGFRLAVLAAPMR